MSPASEEQSSPSAVSANREPVIAPPARSERTLAPPLNSRSKRSRNVIILVAVLVVVGAGVFLWHYLGTYESTDDAQVDVHLYPVSARVGGYVIKVNVGDNQYVEKGTVLVEIDPKDYEVAIAQAQANLASAEATAQSLNIRCPGFQRRNRRFRAASRRRSRAVAGSSSQ